MAKILRGDVVWAQLDPIVGNEQSGLRPVLVISQDIFNARSGTVIAMALTSQPQKASFPLTLPILLKGFKKQSWVKISQIRTISTLRLGKKLGRVDENTINHAIAGLVELVGD
jgi:mRNA interferase MazF